MVALTYIEKNTLVYDPDACINCGMCSMVCPHGAFEAGENSAVLAHKERCMECGACTFECPGSLHLTQMFRVAKGKVMERRKK